MMTSAFQQPLKARKYFGRPITRCSQKLSTKTPLIPTSSVEDNPTPTIAEEDYLPRDKRCLVLRKNLVRCPIISHQDLVQFKILAEQSDNPTKTFLKSVYSSESYRHQLNNVKRGSKALNWRKENIGEFICPSLHTANNIYEAFGKKKWTHSVTRKNYSVANEENRCVCVLKSGKSCSKKRCSFSEYCTLHHRKFILSR
jgi:hypothetical protein